MSNVLFDSRVHRAEAISPAVSVSLKRELQSKGCPVLPKDKVEEFKKQKLAEQREGIWRYMWPVAVFFRLSLPFLLGSSLLGCVAGFFLFCLKIGSAIFSGSVFIASIFFLLLYMGIPRFMAYRPDSGFERATSHWRTLPLEKYFARGLQFFPVRMRTRVGIIEEVGGQAFVDVFQDDPFLVAVRGSEREYVGAWYTMRAEFDSV